MTPVLELRDLHARYGLVEVLHGIDMAIDEREAVGLIGRNGAGKTTTLLSIFGIPATRGEVKVAGSDVTRAKRWRVAQLGLTLVPQGRGIIAGLTVEENLRLGLATGRTGRWTLEAIYELFPALQRAARRPGTALSGGEQQMLSVGRALMSNPHVLLLDEPSEGLSPVAINGLIEVLRHIHENGTSIVVAEQNMRLVEKVVERFVALERGRVALTGPVDELASSEVHRVIGV